MEAILKNLTTKEEAIELANEIERMDSAVKLMKDNLKKYVEDYGPVDTGERVWSINESVSWRFDTEGLMKLAKHLANEQQNPWDYMTLNGTNLKKAIDKTNLSEAELEKISKKRINKRFTSRKTPKK